MADYQEPAPDALWEKLSATIDSHSIQVPPAKKKPHGKFILWLSGIGAAAAVLALVLLTGNESSTIAPVLAPASTVYSSRTATSPKTKIIPASSLKETFAPTLAANSSNSNTTDNGNRSLLPEANTISTSAATTSMPIGDKANTDSNINAANSLFAKSSTGSKVSATSSATHGTYPATNKTSTGYRHISASVYTANLPTSSHSSIGNNTGVIVGADAGYYGNDVLNPDEMNTLLSPKHEYRENTKTTHRLPIKIGASVKFGITDRWGFETGLVYSHLSSHTSSSFEGYSREIEQKLDFIGIPLKVSLGFWKNKHWEVYATAGGMAEKCISGNTDTENVIDGIVVSTECESVKMKRLQFSVEASVGAQVNIMPNLGFYLEPGATYYFDNGSDIVTSYSDRPFNFNLQFGLRFTFK